MNAMYQFPGVLCLRQEGSALIVSLVMLLLLSLIGVAGIQTSLMQDRMTANLLDKDLAFEAAEAALREAEASLDDDVPVSFPNSGGLYRIGASNRPDWPESPSDSGNGVFTYADSFPGVNSQPKYFIEQIDSIPPPGCDLTGYCEPVYYRITALGEGGSDTSISVITTVYRTN